MSLVSSVPVALAVVLLLVVFGVLLTSSSLNSLATTSPDVDDASWGWLSAAAFGGDEEHRGAAEWSMSTDPPSLPLMYGESGNETMTEENGLIDEELTEEDLPPSQLVISPSRHSNVTMTAIRLTEGASIGPFTSGIHIVTTFYKGDYRNARFMEIVTCLKRNLRNKFVTAVHTLWEDRDPINFVSEPTLRAKLIRIEYRTQPTYKDMFDYAQLTLRRGAIAVVANSDIYFDETLHCVVPVTPDRRAYNATRQHVVYALSRHPSPPCASRHDMCEEYIGSHDAFIFALPLAKRIAPRLDFTQNHIGAENVVIWEFKYTRGYVVRNPCHVVHAMHLHCTSERHYHGVTISRGRYRIGNVDRHGSVSSSTLPKCGQVVY